MNIEGVDPHLTAKIVQSYVRHHRLGPDQLSDLITSVHRAISQLGHPPEPNEVLIPAVSVRRSVHRDYVICLDCGYQGKTLRRHISVRHGLNGDEYRRRWGLRSDHPLTAPAYSEKRSTLAKELGLGRKAITETAPVPVTEAAEPVAANVKEQVEASPKPRPTRRSRSNSNVNEAAAEPRARQRRRRSRAAPGQPEPPSTSNADV